MSGSRASINLPGNMRSPQRSRNIALVFFASGWLACVAAFLLPALSEGSWIRTCLFIYGSSAILFGGGTALFRHFDVRAKEALARGEDIVGRWRVDAAGWREFVMRDREWGQEGDALPNELSILDQVPENGIEVIAGRDAVQIGESIHRLTSGMPEVTAAILRDCHPAVIELQLYYPGGGHGASGVPRAASRSALRFPVGTGAWKEAGMVVAHFRGDTPREPNFFHGKGDGTNPEDLSKCGRAMQSKRWSRRYGWILLVLGIFISGVIGLVLTAIGPRLVAAISGSGGRGFSGTSADARMALGILGAVELFGVTAVCYGLWQIVTGRRNKWVIYFMGGICALLVLVAIFI